MRVCLVSYEFPPKGGGEAVYTANLARGIKEMGHHVVLVVPKQVFDPKFAVKLGYTIIPITCVSKPLVAVSSFLSGVRAVLPRLVPLYDIDLIHFTFDYPPFPFRLDSCGLPIVSTVHHLHAVEAANTLKFGTNRASMFTHFARLFVLSYAEKSLLSQSDAIVAVSNFTKRSACRIFGIPSDKVRVIYNSIAPNSFLSPSRSFKYQVTDAPFILYVGRLEKSKGIEYLLEAISLIKQQGKLLRLVVIGDDSSAYAKSLKRHVFRNGIEDRVRFEGRVSDEDLREAYFASSLVVLPSMMEGLPTTLLEAMAAEKPCVATRVGGIPEIVHDGTTGLLVGPADSTNLAKAILRIVENPTSAKSMGKVGREVLESKFTVDKMCSDTEQLYRSLMKRGSASKSHK
ncbi:MAG: glycosyltransferase family 4 protein [Nitrososphaerota archaeon]|nr:glycosyltransferase family 4 protein [Nitrososphaerota archaeon]